MAIAFDAATKSSGTGTSITYAHTCTGSNLILFVLAYGYPNPATGTTYNGVAMTRVTDQIMNAGGPYISVFYLINPATGSNNVVVSGAGLEGSSCASYTGVKQSAQPDAFDSAQVDSASGVTDSITTVADNCWIFSGCQVPNGSANPSPSAGWTERGTGGLAYQAIGDYGPKTPAGAQSITWTFGVTDRGATIEVSFAPVVAAGPANLKTWNGLAKASVKTVDGLAIASVKTINGLS